MSTVTFASMVPDLSAHLPGCPNITIERSARKVVIDLCSRAKVWRHVLPDVTLVVGTYAYIPASPHAYSEIFGLDSGYTIIDSTKRDLYWASVAEVRQQYPAWPQDAAGTPRLITSQTLHEYQLCPVPDTAGIMSLTAYLRPTSTATLWDGDLFHEFHRVVFHGVLHDLMTMPNRTWTNGSAAGYHGKQWTYLLNNAKDRALRGYNGSSLTVEMRPLA